MAITVTGGVVSLNGNASVKATVDTLNFPNANRVNGQVPINAVGVLTIKNVPDYQNFVALNSLNYADSNHNNDAILRVDSVVGPTKYNITRTA